MIHGGNNATKFNVKQLLAFHYLNDPKIKFVAYGGAAGGGKSWLGCDWLLRCCWAFPKTRWFVGRNNIKDSRESVLVTFNKVADSYGFTDYRQTDDGIKFKNGSEIILLDLTFYPKKDPMFERLGSKEFTGGWIEEGGEVHYLAFEVLKSRIGRHLNVEYGLEPKMLITCNPKKNWLYTQFYKPHKNGTLDADCAFVQALVYDNPFVSDDYIKTLESIKNRQTRLRLLSGWWEYEGNVNALVDYDAILDAFTNPVQPNGLRRISADLATRGRDKFIALKWNGLVVRPGLKLAKTDSKTIEKSLEQLASEFGVGRSQIVADSDGLGDYLSSYLTGITEFHGGQPAVNSKVYYNIKSECAFKLAEFINNRQIFIDVDDPADREAIAEELEACLVAHDIDADTSKKRLIDKADQKKILGHSPDWFDNLNMGMIYYIRPQARGARIHVSKLK